MSRGNIITIVIILVVLATLVFYTRSNQDPSDYIKWQFDYRYNADKKPYDRDFCIDYLKTDVGASNFNTLDERLSRTKDLKNGSLYFFYNEDFDIDAIETRALYDFVAKGNSALIIAQDFNYELFKSIRGISVVWDEAYVNEITRDSSKMLHNTVNIRGEAAAKVSIVTYGENPFQASFEIDTVDITNDEYGTYSNADWTDEEIYHEEDYTYEEEEYTDDEQEPNVEENAVELVIADDQTAENDSYTKPTIEVMGSAENSEINLIKIKFGDGHFFLHSQPVLFTNVQLDKIEIYNYVQTIFKEIEYDQVYWDDLKFQFLNSTNKGYGLSDKSYLDYIFKNRALKTAFYFFLIGLLILLIVGIKRKYNSIEIVDEVTNSSIDFSKTIARLYWLNPNHRKMADQKMKMFLFEVRNRYGISTHVLDEEFKILFKAKTGVGDKLINRLFDAYNLASKSQKIHSDVLVQISESIVAIRQTWK